MGELSSSEGTTVCPGPGKSGGLGEGLTTPNIVKKSKAKDVERILKRQPQYPIKDNDLRLFTWNVRMLQALEEQQTKYKTGT